MIKSLLILLSNERKFIKVQIGQEMWSTLMCVKTQMIVLLNEATNKILTKVYANFYIKCLPVVYLKQYLLKMIFPF